MPNGPETGDTDPPISNNIREEFCVDSVEIKRLNVLVLFSGGKGNRGLK